MAVFEVLGTTIDARTNTNIVYVKAGVVDYINLVGDDFDDFEIQRKKVKHSAYARMKQDIIDGTLLPAISLAVKSNYIKEIEEFLLDKNSLTKLLNRAGIFNIMDGLQRTHVIKEIISENVVIKDNQTLLLEFWLEKDIKNLIYRIIILNAGQKPMSMRHQIELLFQTARETIIEKIPGIEIFTEREEARRTRAKKYPLSRVALSYYSYITKSPEVDKDNIVAMQLQESEILNAGEAEFGKKFDRFLDVFEKFVDIDFNISNGDPIAMQWIASENVMLALFAAAGNISSRDGGEDKVNAAIDMLLANIVNQSENFSLGVYDEVLKGINPKKSNVGFATRKLLFNSFREYFKEGGHVNFSDLWLQEAS